MTIVFQCFKNYGTATLETWQTRLVSTKTYCSLNHLGIPVCQRKLTVALTIQGSRCDKSPCEEISGGLLTLSGDTLYMSSTLIKVILFIPSHPICYFVLRGDIESHGLSISLHRDVDSGLWNFENYLAWETTVITHTTLVHTHLYPSVFPRQVKRDS